MAEHGKEAKEAKDGKHLGIRVDGERAVKLTEVPTDLTGGMDKSGAEERVAAIGQELSNLLDLLFYAGTHAFVIILQGRDTSGKDGTIRRILTYSSVQSCRVEAFKVPTAEEAAHDFLWRIHRRTPARGNIAIFNRSHYEDVLAVRIHKLVPKPVWKRRYAHINHFESLLRDNNTLLAKFFLHVSKEEQERRLLAREQDTEKAWKLNVGDWKERELWDEYTEAAEDALNRCGTPEAPWTIVPADHKWYRDVVVLSTLVETLKPHSAQWLEKLREIGKASKAEIDAYRQSHPIKRKK